MLHLILGALVLVVWVFAYRNLKTRFLSKSPAEAGPFGRFCHRYWMLMLPLVGIATLLIGGPLWLLGFGLVQVVALLKFLLGITEWTMETWGKHVLLVED